MDLGINGKTALVTASSKGLGYGSALALATEGVNIFLCGRDGAALEIATDELRKTGAGNVASMTIDVTEPEAPEHLVQATVERFGSIDIVVGNAGGPPPMRALEIDDDAIAAAINANFTTSVKLVQQALPHMQRSGWGRVCLITSSSVKQPIPTLALSNVARTALWAWAKTAAADVRESGVTINLACPGYHATDRMKSLGVKDRPMGDPADFGSAVAFLCSQQAAFINGTALTIDGGAVAGLL